MSFAFIADNANALNTVMGEMGYKPELGFSRVGGPVEPLVEAMNENNEVVIKIRFEKEYFVIDAVDYKEGFGGQTSFETLEELELSLLEQGVGIYRQW